MTEINAFNAKSKAAEIGKLLDSYILNVEKMQTQPKRCSGAFTDTVRENKKLKKTNEQLSVELKETTSESVKKKIQDIQLRRDYEDALSVLERILPEVSDIYAKIEHGGKEKPIEEVLFRCML